MFENVTGRLALNTVDDEVAKYQPGDASADHATTTRA